MKSIKVRAMIGSAIWASVTVLIGGFGLARYLEFNLEQEFRQRLLDRSTQVVVALANTNTVPARIEDYINDPVYKRPLSGEYWQVVNDQAGIFTSLSLLDGMLPEGDTGAPGSLSFWQGSLDDGEPVLGVLQTLELQDGSSWEVNVASSLEPLHLALVDVRKRLSLAIGVITVVGIFSTILLTYAILAPLATLRKDVTARWDSEDGLEEDRYPMEVAPLVRDINTLLDRNRSIVERSRRQAVDLAHAIKTPSAIVRNELEQLQRNGVDAEKSIEALDRLDAQLKRCFARMRASGAEDLARAQTDLDHSLGRMVRAFSALSKRSGKELECRLQRSMKIRMDASDFEEIAGNLLDNAFKFSTSRIRVSSRQDANGSTLSVEDDGPGIPCSERHEALASGKRLDTSKPGTGLGLAIASDIAHAYGGELSLDTSPMGGLKVDFILSNKAA